jgi:hypothetical protein
MITRAKNLRKVLAVALALLPAAVFGARNSFPGNASPEEFAKWQVETRALLKDFLFNGPAPEAVALNPVYGRTEDRPRYTLTEVTFQDRRDHATHGWLARPKEPAGPRLPVVIALHGHDYGAYDTFNPQNMYFYGDLFASLGYIVFAPDIGHDFIDHDRPLTGLGPLPRNVPFPYMGQKTWMAMRSIDFVSGLADANPDMIGAVGLSNGGLTTMFLAAVDPRVKIAVSAGILIMHHKFFHPPITPCRCEYLDRMDGVLDYYDVYALIAPRPLVIENGVKDRGFPVKSSIEAFAYIQRAYAVAGAPDQVIHVVHPGAHEFVPEVPLKWFQNYLPLPAG